MTAIDPTVYQSPVSSGPPTEAPSRDLGSDDFLNLLMTQLGNQDPLNPMETSQFMDQVTAMNSLQQQMATNDLLNQLVFATGSLNNQAAVNLVGREVVAAGDTFPHESGATEELIFSLADEAASATITVTNESGDVVRVIERVDLKAGEQSATWNGLDAEGNALPDGEYTFTVSAVDEDDVGVASSTYIRGVVDELRFDSGSPLLVIGGQEVALPNILRVIGGGSQPPPEVDLDDINAALGLADTGGAIDAGLLATLSQVSPNNL